MQMRFALSLALLVGADGLRRSSKKNQPKTPEMRSDKGLALDEVAEAEVSASGPDARFENQIHQAKMSQVWWKVVADQRISPMPSAWKAALDSLSMMVLSDFFDYHNDEKPKGQAKVIHMQGVACKFDMKVYSTSKYTGLFAPGSNTGLMRMGPPAPDVERAGMSLKWFRSYQESANTVMAATEGSANFFEHDLTNHINLFHIAPLALMRKILRQTQCAGSTGLSELAKYDQDGNAAGSSIKFPYEFQLEPVNRALAPFPAGRNFTTQALLSILRTIPVGTKLYYVKVREYPGAPLQRIGELKLASECSYSMYADLRMNFQHRRIEDDIALRPEWERRIKQWCDEQA